MKAFFKNNRGFIAFLLCFGVFRLAIADWNPVPSAGWCAFDQAPGGLAR